MIWKADSAHALTEADAVPAATIRTNVSFRYPAEFVSVSDGDDILAVSGAQWFADLLRQIPQLQVDDDLGQEDWGVVVFVRRNSKKFWIGLSLWPEGEHAWLAHFHHGPFALWQRLSPSGRHELQRLVAHAHDVLASDPAVWYYEKEMCTAFPREFTTPFDG